MRPKLFLIFAAALGSALLASAPAMAQQFNVDFGDGASTTGRIVQLVALLTVLSLAPSILVMVTSFTRIVVVLGFLRHALGTQTSPPNMVIVSLSLFLTGFVMAPTFEAAYTDGIQPLIENRIDEMTAFDKAVKPFHAFMMRQVRDQDLKLFLDLFIDMVIASILMSMGMMMLPPASISMPFKLIFFVLVDGWYLIAGSLVQSFGTG